MAAKSKTTQATNGKKNGQTAKGKKSASKTSKRRKEPRNLEETYAKRDKRFKIWENR